jgi:hypothetical protein
MASTEPDHIVQTHLDAPQDDGSASKAQVDAASGTAGFEAAVQAAGAGSKPAAEAVQAADTGAAPPADASAASTAASNGYVGNGTGSFLSRWSTDALVDEIIARVPTCPKAQQTVVTLFCGKWGADKQQRLADALLDVVEHGPRDYMLHAAVQVPSRIQTWRQCERLPVATRGMGVLARAARKSADKADWSAAVRLVELARDIRQATAVRMPVDQLLDVLYDAAVSGKGPSDTDRIARSVIERGTVQDLREVDDYLCATWVKFAIRAAAPPAGTPNDVAYCTAASCNKWLTALESHMPIARRTPALVRAGAIPAICDLLARAPIPGYGAPNKELLTYTLCAMVADVNDATLCALLDRNGGYLRNYFIDAVQNKGAMACVQTLGRRAANVTASTHLQVMEARAVAAEATIERMQAQLRLLLAIGSDQVQPFGQAQVQPFGQAQVQACDQVQVQVQAAASDQAFN